MRFLSSIVFAVMALVLPVAGVQMQFCTVLMAFVEGADGCPAEKDDCCGKKDCSKPADCMVTAKLLPNAEKHTPLQLPAADGVWEMLPVMLGEGAVAHSAVCFSPEKERGPPDRSRLFMALGCLLI